MVYDNILLAIGNTPAIKLNRIIDENCSEIIVKYEGLNVGGSIKTRTAYNMIVNAEKEGLISQDTIIVEPTSGNQGIGLAMVCAVKGYRAIIVMPDSVSEERRKLIKNYGAEVVLVHDSGNIGECIDQCLNKAIEIKMNNKNVYIPQQFMNKYNVAAHKNQTAEEIVTQIGKKIDGFCSGIGTGGTITGAGERLKKENPDTVIWAVEPENAAILSGGCIGTHLQMGIGDGIIPPILNDSIYDKICLVSDDDAINMAKKLAKLEGIMCGISSGSNVFAALKMAKELGPGKTVVTILPDTAERYFSTPLF